MAQPTRFFAGEDLPVGIGRLLSPTSGVLCLGHLLTPYQTGLLGGAVDLPSPAWLFAFTTAGTSTVERTGLGILARVPEGDPLAVLASSYYESNLPGYTEWMDWKTPLAEVIALQSKLSSIGLEIHAYEYSAFAEGLIPIDFESALGYVLARQLEIVVDFDRAVYPSFADTPLEWRVEASRPRDLPSVHSPEALEHLIGRAWNEAVTRPHWERYLREGGVLPFNVRPDGWAREPMAFMIVDNSD